MFWSEGPSHPICWSCSTRPLKGFPIFAQKIALKVATCICTDSIALHIICIYVYIPGTQLTLVLIRKGLLLEGWSTKMEDKQVTGIYIYKIIYILYTWYSIQGSLPPPQWYGILSPTVSPVCLKELQHVSSRLTQATRRGCTKRSVKWFEMFFQFFFSVTSWGLAINPIFLRLWHWKR